MKHHNWIKYAQQNNRNIILSGDWILPPEVIKLLNIEHNSIYHEESVLRHTEEVVKTVAAIDYEDIFGPILPDVLDKQQILSDIKNILITAAALHDIGKQNRASNFTCNKCGEHTFGTICKNCGNKDPNKFSQKIKYLCRRCQANGKFSHSNRPICQICGSAAKNNDEVNALFKIIPNQQFIGHESEGWQIAGQFMKNVPEEYQFIIRLLIKNHMQFGQSMMNNEQEDRERFFSINKLLNKIEINHNWISPEIFFKMSAILAVADHISRQQEMTTPILEINELLNMLDIGSNLEIQEIYNIDQIPREQILQVLPELIQRFYLRYEEVINGPIVKLDIDKNDVPIFDAIDPNIFKKIALINQFLQENQCNFEVKRGTLKKELLEALEQTGKKELMKDIARIIKKGE